MLVALRAMLSGAAFTCAERWLAQGQYVNPDVLRRVWARGGY